MESDQAETDYNRDGFHGPFSMSNSSAIDRLMRRYEELGYEFFWSKRNQHVIVPEVAEIARHPDILSKVSEIIGPNILCWIAHVLPRKPEAELQRKTGTPWHIDGINKILEGVHVSIALTEMTVENGCMRLLPRSHELDRPSMIALRDKMNDPDTPKSVQPEPIFVVAKPGQFFLMHGGTLHAAGSNFSDKTRIALVVRYCHPSKKATNVPRVRRTASNDLHSDGVTKIDDNEADLLPCLLVQGEDRFKLNDIRSMPE